MRSIAPLLLSVSAALHGQDCVHSLVADPLGSLQTPGSGSRSYPMNVGFGGGGDSVRTQIRLISLRFQNAPIQITGLAFSMTTDGTIGYSSLRVQMAHAAAGASYPKNRSHCESGTCDVASERIRIGLIVGMPGFRQDVELGHRA